MKVRGKWKKTLALLVSMAMLLGMMPDLTLTAVKAAAEENAAESTQTVSFEGIDGTSGCGYGEGYESLFDGKYTDEVIVKTSKKKLEAYKKLLKKRGISRNASFES